SGRAASARCAPAHWSSRRRSEVELGDVAQDGVDLAEHLPALVLQTAVVASQAVVLLAQARHGLGGATHRGFQLREAIGEGVAHAEGLSAPRSVRPSASQTRRATRAWIAFTSSSVRVRSSAWNVSRKAMLRRPSGSGNTS